MKVKCIKNTKRLVKGHIYEVNNLWNNNANKWRNPTITIVGFNIEYVIDNFRNINGSKLSNINYTRDVNINIPFEIEEIHIGDILVCTSDTYKTFVRDGKYKIEKIIQVDNQYINTYVTKSNKIKFVGIKRTINLNSWKFRKLNKIEIRKQSLDNIFYNTEQDIITSENIRKIDLIKNKDDILLKTLAKSIIDENRHHLSIVEWACEKKGDKLALNVEDFEPYMNITLKELLKKIK